MFQRSLKALLIAGLPPAIELQKLQIQKALHTGAIVGCTAVFVMPEASGATSDSYGKPLRAQSGTYSYETYGLRGSNLKELKPTKGETRTAK